MQNKEKPPDLSKLACKIVWRLNMLCDRSDAASAEFAKLAVRVRDALEEDDTAAQRALLDDVKAFLDSSSEIHEDIRNVFQMFFYYVHLHDGANESGYVWWARVG